MTKKIEINIDEVPEDIIKIWEDDTLNRTKMRVKNIKKLMAWVRSQFPEKKSDTDYIVCIKGPMTNLAAMQIVTTIARNITGDMYYTTWSGQTYKLNLDTWVG